MDIETYECSQSILGLCISLLICKRESKRIADLCTYMWNNSDKQSLFIYGIESGKVL